MKGGRVEGVLGVAHCVREREAGVAAAQVFQQGVQAAAVDRAPRTVAVGHRLRLLARPALVDELVDDAVG